MAFLRCPQCALKCGTHYVPYDILRLLKMGFRQLESSHSESVLKKHLTEEMLEYLKFLRTANDVNLYDCIKCGLELHDSKVGIFACDPDSYFVFAPIFQPILNEIHGFGPEDVHPKSSWFPCDRLANLDAKRKYIKLIRIRVARNLTDYPFCSQMNQSQFEKIEEFVIMILALMTGEYDGTYEKLSDMMDDRRRELQQKGFLFDNKNKFLEAGGAHRCWPHGRGVFINADQNFVVWVNPYDHLKIISVEHGGNLRRVYERALRGVKKIKRDLNFIVSKRMGYITFCPEDLGTGLKASMHVLLPNLALHPDKLEEKVREFNINIKRVPGNDELYEISNRKRLGITEIDSVSILQNGVLELISYDESFISDM